MDSRTDCKFIDLAGELLPLLKANAALPVDRQIEEWQAFHAVHAPELPPMLCRDYENLPGGWKEVARKRVFPMLPGLFERMSVALENIRESSGEILGHAVSKLGFSEPLRIVSYVGLSNGAGWATKWGGFPAVLLGLESIAELGWHEKGKVMALTAHEAGHLFMSSKRSSANSESLAHSALSQLYEEGFAQHCEHIVMGRRTWSCESQEGWLEWCSCHEANLARRYLLSMGDAQEWRRFFGSWFEVDGWRQTGYYLGCKFIEEMEKTHKICDIAIWGEADVKRNALRHLESLSKS